MAVGGAVVALSDGQDFDGKMKSEVMIHKNPGGSIHGK